MFNDSERKLKAWASFQGVFFTVLAVAVFLLIFTSVEGVAGILLGLIVAFIVWFLSMISVWTLYSFADLVEYTKATYEEISQMSAGLAEYTKATNQTLNAMSSDLYFIAKHYGEEPKKENDETVQEETADNETNDREDN